VIRPLSAFCPAGRGPAPAGAIVHKMSCKNSFFIKLLNEENGVTFLRVAV
jgi:hypothetical protein